jgi:glycine/D-amino acid oxidase-like deaminating enzyme
MGAVAVTDDYSVHVLCGSAVTLQVLICSACSGHGFKMASAIGEVMADLAETGRTDMPIEPFSISRFSQER